MPLIERQGDDLIVSGSTGLDQLALYAAENGLEGLNNTAGIPGTVGGAIVGNAGAFGKQIGDVVKTINVIGAKGGPKTLKADELGFTYRNSNLKHSGDIVVSARLALRPFDSATLLTERKEILKLRHEKHPDLSVHPCAGSFFRNVEPTSNAGKRQAAGWFLEQAGAKDLEYGGAKIFAKHANIIVKSENCRAQDVFELSRRMARLVKDKFHLDLIREVRFVGKFDGMPGNIKDVVW
jgi:UDP-N-acetylmuramate dehydrogenase